VRLLSRHADDDVREYARGVEPHVGDVTDRASLRGSADGCDAVLHVVGIVAESPPDVTFEKVNVQGTRHVLDEVERAGVARLVYVSSLGAERGESPYHVSKRQGEEIVRGFSREWVIVRPGNVYGPGDEVISLLLKMVRTLPAVPVIAGGDQAFQPLWAGDLALALASTVEREDVARRVVELAGPERTSMNDLLDRFARLTDRSPARLPLPGMLASIGVKIASTVGVDLPINESQLTMLREGNVIGEGSRNELADLMGAEPTPLDRGLALLADTLPEQLPSDGVGKLERKRFWADIEGSKLSAAGLFSTVCRNFQEVTPDRMDLDAEPDTPSAVLELGQTVTMALPMRGNVQVRVEELTPTRATLATVEGHPLAGAVRLSVEPVEDDAGGTLRFAIEVFDRAANVLDWLGMFAVGGVLQNATWKQLVERVVEESGGTAPEGVQHESTKLDAEAAAEAERALAELVAARKRQTAPK
jgi:NADH dehydrogenase